MAQKKRTIGGKGRAKSKPAKPRKAAAAGAGARQAAADRAVIAELRAENRRLRAELAALRRRETPARPAPTAGAVPTGVPILPLGVTPADPAA